MKSHLLALMILLFCCTAAAQTPQPNKIVYLKDGTNVKGTVTVNDSAGYIAVVDKYKESRYYQKSMVAKIDTFEPHQRSYSLKSKGYVCNIELGGTDILTRDGGTNIPALSFNVVNSYLISPYASIGMGVGAEIAGNNTETFSLYANSRIYFIKSDISPFMDLSYGYTAMFVKGFDTYYIIDPGPLPYYNYISRLNTSQGMTFNPSFGIRVAASKKIAITTSLGYKLYYLHNSNPFPYITTFNENADRAYSLGHALTFKIGFQF